MTTRRLRWILPFLLLFTSCGGQAKIPNPVTNKPCQEQIRNFVTGHEVKDEVGGMWLIPPANQDITGQTLIQVQAYPAEKGNPQKVHHVKFTMDYPKWRIVAEVCTSDVTISNVYTLTLDLAVLEVPPGTTFQFSFDVYSVTGNYNKSPHGPRTLTFKPTQ